MKKNILLVIAIVLIVIIGVLTLLEMKNRKEEEFTYCKRRIYEFDEIAKGCDKYFSNEDWYKTYMKEVNKNYESLK